MSRGENQFHLRVKFSYFSRPRVVFRLSELLYGRTAGRARNRLPSIAGRNVSRACSSLSTWPSSVPERSQKKNGDRIITFPDRLTSSRFTFRFGYWVMISTISANPPRGLHSVELKSTWIIIVLLLLLKWVPRGIKLKDGNTCESNIIRKYQTG